MRLSRRRLLRSAPGAAALVLAPRAVRAQTYPARPVTLVVFIGAGGSPDIIARLIGQSLSQRLGQGVVIDNRPGGGGNLALQAVARSPADGYTLLLIATPHAINVTLYEKLSVNLRTDIVPIASINSDSFVMVVNPASPYKSVGEFIAHAKANPGKINLTSSGTGNLSHLSGELFRMRAGIEMVHVPYRGTVPALTALMAREMDVMFDALPSSLPHIQSGRLRAIAVTADARVKPLPEIPPLAETLPGYAVTGWLGIGAPKGTPADIVGRLNREINAVLAEPAIRARLAGLGSEPLAGSAADFDRLITTETEKWAEVVRFAGIKAD